MVSETDESPEQIDKFIRRMHDRELVFKPPLRLEAIKRAEFKHISQSISESILKYQGQKSGSYQKGFCARIGLFWINRAYTMGFIDEGKGITTKINRLESDNKRLRDRLDECNKERQRLEKEIERIHNLFPDTRTFTGDVQGE
jgi:hypothetical protein